MRVEYVSVMDSMYKKLITAIGNEANGVVVGWILQNKVVITGCMQIRKPEDITHLVCFLPPGIEVCGTFGLSEQQNIDYPVKHIHIGVSEEPQTKLTCKCLDTGRNVTVTDVTFEQTAHVLKLQSVLFQIVGLLDVTVVVKKGVFDIEIKDMTVKDGIFEVTDQKKLIYPDMNIVELVNDVRIEHKNAFFLNPFEELFHTVEVKFMECLSVEAKPPVPVMRIMPLGQSYRRLKVNLNALCFVDKTSSLSYASLSKPFKTAVHRQLYLLKKSILEDCQISDVIPTAHFHHFYIPGWCHPVTVCYPANQTEKNLTEFRKDTLHSAFMQSTETPVFCRVLEVYKKSEVNLNPAVISPHRLVKPPKMQHSKISLVDGNYSYYHYKQDGFDDSGWGCAYRSLQTLVSWFRMQGYSEQPVPNHSRIQALAVEVKDRKPKFIGSKEWIGAIEVGNILKHYLGIEVKTLNVPKGSEMTSLGRQLAQHFETNGTPIMIGGGVLAHTIVGISFSNVTGETMFLVLDPHYTGIDTTERILGPGWCAWKDKKFWNQSAFYNLCLPQKPFYC